MTHNVNQNPHSQPHVMVNSLAEIIVNHNRYLVSLDFLLKHAMVQRSLAYKKPIYKNPIHSFLFEALIQLELI